MSDFLNKDVPVANGVEEGVSPNTTILYPWMSIKSGDTSYFKEIRMRGDLYDKDNNIITGSISGLSGVGSSLSIAFDNTTQTNNFTSSGEKQIVKINSNSGNVLEYKNRPYQEIPIAYAQSNHIDIIYNSTTPISCIVEVTANIAPIALLGDCELILELATDSGATVSKGKARVGIESVVDKRNVSFTTYLENITVSNLPAQLYLQFNAGVATVGEFQISNLQVKTQVVTPY